MEKKKKTQRFGYADCDYTYITHINTNSLIMANVYK